jgi:GntR family transcriptional regulator, transcriptional repressor for pyruvate dehydrogenase complex
MLDILKPIEIINPVDNIIHQIRDLISSGELLSGDKLPSERKLAEHFGVSRNQVREALGKLEFYGILKTSPQSGTSVAGIGIVALEGLISDVLQLENSDFGALVETRLLLECEAVKLAATRRTADDIINLTNALSAYERKILSQGHAVDEDLLFHVQIAEASKNSVLKSLMIVITPDILQNYDRHKVCKTDEHLESVQEHRTILEHIINKDSVAAAMVMNDHLKNVLQLTKYLK